MPALHQYDYDWRYQRANSKTCPRIACMKGPARPGVDSLRKTHLYLLLSAVASLMTALHRHAPSEGTRVLRSDSSIPHKRHIVASVVTARAAGFESLGGHELLYPQLPVQLKQYNCSTQILRKRRFERLVDGRVSMHGWKSANPLVTQNRELP